MEANIVAGIDVSKRTLDVCILPGKKSTNHANDVDGIQEIVKLLVSEGVQKIVLESTGGYEREVVYALGGAGLAVVRENPRQTSNYAKVRKKLAKNDKIDAALLADYALHIPSTPMTMPNQQEKLLAALSQRHRQISLLGAKEKNHLEHALPELQQEIRESIQNLDHRLKLIDKQITEILNNDEQLRERRKILQSMPGVGPVVSQTLIIALRELGSISNKQISALLGVTPYANDSGRHRGARTIWGGRRSPRSMMFMAALSASMKNNALGRYYRRLLAQGKPKMVALVALMHKMIVTLNAMIRTSTMWNDNLVTPKAI